jgi:hypothetical protein
LFDVILDSLITAIRKYKSDYQQLLKRIFGPQVVEVAESWRTLHNEELHNLYTSPNIVMVMKSGDIWRGM